MLPLPLLDSRFAQRVVVVAGGAQVALRECAAASTESDASPVIVLLHGIGSGAASWLHCASALEAQGRVIAWDAPGYGESTPLVPSAPLASDYAQRLDELLAALHVARCVLVGHSLGALMGAAFSHGIGRARISRLVLLSPARGYGAPGQDDARREVLDRRLATLHSGGIEGMAAQSADRMLTPQASAAARAWVQWNMGRLNPAGYTQALQMLCADDIARYAPIAVPVEVHCGDGDAVTPPAASRDVATLLDAPFALIPQAGHACPVEQPEAVAQLIARAAAAAASESLQP